MSDIHIPIPKVTDGAVLKFFQELMSKHQFNTAQIWIGGLDSPLLWGNSDTKEIEQKNKYSIRQTSSTKNNHGVVTYNRNSDPNRFATPDTIRISNNNGVLNAKEVIQINELIADSFLRDAAQIGALTKDPNAFAAVIASHQQIVTRLEETLTSMAQDFAEERRKLQNQSAEELQKKTAELYRIEQATKEAYEKKETALIEREKALDDRANMHARRGIRADLKKRLQEHALKFTLTDKTRQLRWPLHITVWLSLAAFVAAIGYCWWLMGSRLDYALLAKSTLLTIAALGILTWYIRWMNRWFDQHADAEFNLKQFELDVDRASWVVETAMEWRASQHGAIPTHLLESISRNLFYRTERQNNEEIHPADYLASALLGNASRARIKFGDAELDYSRGALKRAAKAVEE